MINENAAPGANQGGYTKREPIVSTPIIPPSGIERKPPSLDPLLRAQAEAIESYIFAHGKSVVRYMENGEPLFYKWCAFGFKNYGDLQAMGWRYEDILNAMRAIHERGGNLWGQYPGVLAV